ncbi:GDSL-type esterase/lipase family protein [Niameybacter massiliensis]|uniref:GDSL-type esterase/lipase family protein n=1 Tax=Niameybacter massiliensis TaxID=1658108 RepID=UPI0006B59D7A|nr:GDSL-type esterase/lipase family protein [Niameybacter massiliensis]
MEHQNSISETYIQSPQPWPYVLNRRETFEILPPKEGCILFVGDSITQRNEWAEMFNNPNIINRGIDSDRLTWLNERMPNLLANKPSKIFIKIGINDIMDGKRAMQMQEEYKVIFDQFKTLDDCTVYVQSCLPVNNTVYEHPIDNTVVQSINEMLEPLANEYGFKFINLYEHFVDSNNELVSDYTRDGVHLNGTGYLVWKKQIEQYV